jgi:hypothetical protein
MLSLALACMHAGIRQRFGGDASDGATCRKEGGREGGREEFEVFETIDCCWEVCFVAVRFS